MRLYTAREWARLGWHGRARVRLARLRLVEQLQREHLARYPDRQRALCSEPGCRTPSRALGMCDTDYRRWRRSGAA